MKFGKHTPAPGSWFLSTSWSVKPELIAAAVSGDAHSQSSMPEYWLASISAGGGSLVKPLRDKTIVGPVPLAAVPVWAKVKVIPLEEYGTELVCPAMHMACVPEAPPSSDAIGPGNPAGSGPGGKLRQPALAAITTLWRGRGVSNRVF